MEFAEVDRFFPIVCKDVTLPLNERASLAGTNPD